MNRRLMIALGALVVVAAIAATGFSSAMFTSSTSSSGRVTAAADWTAPVVSLKAPATTVNGTVALTATASDADSGLDTVVLQYKAADGSTWVNLCTRTTFPVACDWSTTALPDGAYELRARATDKSGNTATSAVVKTVVANKLTVSLARPADPLRGTAALTTTVGSAGSADFTVRVQRAPAGTTTWTTICENLTSPYACSWSTAGLASGYYDLRAEAVNAGTTLATSAVVSRVLVDNTLPTVTMSDPGTPLVGTKTFTATAADAHSGVADVQIQYSTGSAWTTLCTVTTAPYSCSYDTSKLANGTYSFRAVATDKVGLTTTSAAVTGRVVANTVSTVKLASLAEAVKGTITLNAATTTTGTITSVAIQRSPQDAGSWTTICTDTTSPYSCSLDTTQLGEGGYDFRAVLTDSNGRTTTSDLVTTRVDNVAPKGYDVQTTNSTGQRGRIDVGDTITLTYSEEVRLSSILAGWDGSAVGTTSTVSGTLFSPKGDSVDVGGSGINLGTIDLEEDFIFTTGFVSATVNGTMSATTVTVDGQPRTVVTFTITSLGSNSGRLTTTDGPASMLWAPASGVTDLAGNPVSTARVTERGPVDLDF